MAGYFEAYGVSDARREKVTRWIVIMGILAVIAGFVLYFVLRTYPARRQVNSFLGDLRSKDYHAAYRLWGCAQPCRDYSFESFLEDWGPKSAFAKASAARVSKTSFCNQSVIVTVTSPAGGDIALMYQRSDGTLGFSPWPVCAQHIPTPSAVAPPKGLP